MITNVEEPVCPQPPNRRPLKLDQQTAQFPPPHSAKENAAINAIQTPSRAGLEGRNGKRSVLCFLRLKENEKQQKGDPKEQARVAAH